MFMQSSQTIELTIELPPGPLGVNIQQSAVYRDCIIISKNEETSPLQVGDVIESINGKRFTNMKGGLQAWVKLLKATSNDARSVVIRRNLKAMVSLYERECVDSCDDNIEAQLVSPPASPECSPRTKYQRVLDWDSLSIDQLREKANELVARVSVNSSTHNAIQ